MRQGVLHGQRAARVRKYSFVSGSTENRKQPFWARVMSVLYVLRMIESARLLAASGDLRNICRNPVSDLSVEARLSG